MDRIINPSFDRRIRNVTRYRHRTPRVFLFVLYRAPSVHNPGRSRLRVHLSTSSSPVWYPREITPGLNLPGGHLYWNWQYYTRITRRCRRPKTTTIRIFAHEASPSFVTWNIRPKRVCWIMRSAFERRPRGGGGGGRRGVEIDRQRKSAFARFCSHSVFCKWCAPICTTRTNCSPILIVVFGFNSARNSVTSRSGI